MTEPQQDLTEPLAPMEPAADSTRFAVTSLLIANLMPIFGVVFLGWDTGVVLLIYWCENLVVGFYNLLKMAMAKGDVGGGASKFFILPFFTVHFGGFCAGHAVFILVLTQNLAGGGLTDFDPFPDSSNWPGPLIFVGLFVNIVGLIAGQFGWQLIFPVLALMVSHGISFYENYIGKKEYETRSVGVQMFAPYGRIVVMHIAIIVGGVPVMLLGSPIPLLIILVVFKIGLDLKLHFLSHGKGLGFFEGITKKFSERMEMVQRLKNQSSSNESTKSDQTSED